MSTSIGFLRAAAAMALLGLVLWSGPLVALEPGSVALVADLQPGPSTTPANQGPPLDFLALGDRTLFVGWDEGSWSNLWSTAGSAGEHRIVYPGHARPLFAVGALAYFEAAGELPGLWVTDGTPAGSERLLELDAQNPGRIIGLPPLPGSSQSFFLRCERQRCEIWSTRGTPASTQRVASVSARGYFSNVEFVRAGERLFFSIPEDFLLYASDGTSQGTSPLGGADALPLAAVGGRVLFGRDGQLWSSDGSVARTIALTAIAGDTPHVEGPAAILPRIACYSVHGALIGSEVLCSDGTALGTRQITEFGYAYAIARPPVSAGKLAYFAADDGVSGRRLWVTDGTKAGTRVVAGCVGGCPLDPQQMQPAGSRLLFVATDADGSKQVFVSDGTGPGTRSLGRHCKVACTQPNLIGARGSLAFFTVAQPVAGGGTKSVVLRTDGTRAGTWRLALGAIAAPNSPYVPLVSVSDPRGAAWLIGTGGRGGQTIWRYDGTGAAPKKIFELERSRRSCGPLTLGSLGGGAFAACPYQTETLWFATPGSPPVRLIERSPFQVGFLVTAGGRALWTDGQQPFLSDGTIAGTIVLPRPPNSYVTAAAPFGDRFALLGSEYTDEGTLSALYRVDPETPEAVRIKTFDDRSFSGLESSGGYVYFEINQRLWRSDLTAAGTVEMSGGYSSGLSSLIRFGPVVLWKTQYGLRWLRDDETMVHNLASNLRATDLTAVGSRLFVRTGDGLYRIDLDRLLGYGTAEPLLLKRLGGDPDGYSFEFHNRLAALPDGRVLFAAYTAESGYELHVSDGTPAGTRRFLDLYPGPLKGLRSDPVAVGRGVAFVGRDDDHGKELWYSEGTVASTVRVTDIWEGDQSSSPGNFFGDGSRLYFSADDGIKGREWWVFEAPRERR